MIIKTAVCTFLATIEYLSNSEMGETSNGDVLSLAENGFDSYKYTSIKNPKRKYEVISCTYNPNYRRILIITLKSALVIFIAIFVGIPLVFKYSPSFQRQVIFLNYVTFPKNPTYSDPAKYGIDGARNIYLTSADNITLGVWQILPENLVNTPNSDTPEYFENALNNGQHVFIYNHGNTGHRVEPHRVELYHLLRRHFHVIAYDYRSYGDSSDVDATEIGVVLDCKFIYEWVRNRTSSKIFMWGHSLGAAVSTRTAAMLGRKGEESAGLVLEGAFNNMKEELSEHPYTILFRYLPWFSATVVEPIEQSDFRFENDKHIISVNCPILFLHSEDDGVVPYRLGKKLYDLTVENRLVLQGSIAFHTFKESFEYGHKYICRAPEIDSMIMHFVERSISENEERGKRRNCSTFW